LETIFFIAAIFIFGFLQKEYQKFCNTQYKLIAHELANCYLDEYKKSFFGNTLYIPRGDNHEFNFYWLYTRFVKDPLSALDFENYFLENQNNLLRFCNDNARKWYNILDKIKLSKMTTAKIYTHADFFNEHDNSENELKRLKDSFEKPYVK